MALQKHEVLARIRSTGLVPVLRAGSENAALALALAIAEAGVDVLEVTMTIPHAIRVMERLTKEHPGILVGAGTVLDAQTAQRCIDHGAQFVVSPALHVGTVALCNKLEVAVFPGGLTPTEIVAAHQAGADAVKVFPADSMGGPKYLRSIKAPLPHIELIPTGGVSLATAREFLDAGAVALGVGADLVDTRAIAAGRPESVTEKARTYLAIVREFQREARVSA